MATENFPEVNNNNNYKVFRELTVISKEIKKKRKEKAVEDLLSRL